MNRHTRRILTLTVFLVVITVLFLPVSAATTQVQVVKFANDNTTVLSAVNVTYQQMRDTMPVLGDGTTHYYHQGPVFIDDANETLEQILRWNADEDTNVEEKDMGAVRGTNVKDLCELAGGMSPGDRVKIIASDGWYKWFAYRNVYGYSSREGPIGICWYKNGNYPDSGYTEGMRMVWFADDSVNPWGIHAFGNSDWHEAADPEYWYYYISGSESYPTTTGLSGMNVNRIYIYSNEEPPVMPVAAFSADPVSGTAPLTVLFTDSSANSPTSRVWDFGDGNNSWGTAETTFAHTYTATGTYDVTLAVINTAGSDSEVKDDYITVSIGVLTIPGQANPPTDPDGDGMYEDLSGNSAKDFKDVQLYFGNMAWIKDNQPIGFFDFSGNSDIDFKDVQMLFAEI